ncbi:MAG: DUF3696 domain-containing protein [bacterium]|nr:DUF3696 domain-containing protein [bacterium]
MINNIGIKNFKCFLDQPVELNNLTVLAGANGVGKSTVIQSLLLVRQTIDKIRQDLDILRNSDIDFSKAHYNIHLNEAYNLNLGNSKFITSANTDAERFTFTVSFPEQTVPFEYLASNENPELSARFNLNKKVLESLQSNKNSSLLSDSFHYLAAERIGPRDKQDISDQEFYNTGYGGEYTGYAIYKSGDSLVDEKKCINIEEKGKLFQKQVEAWMDLIVPGVEILPKLFEEINAVRVGLRKRMSGTDYLQPGNIGFGITYVLPIIVSGLIAKENCMLIVENPEAHLHPAGQSNIGKFLARIAASGVQVVIETHSEHIINGIRLAILKEIIPHKNITINFFCHEEKNATPDVKAISINEKADLDFWPRGFLDQEEIDLAEIFKLSRSKKK